jgi:hypothetical protein
MVESNLRLPIGMDADLLDRLILAATDYVEKTTNVCLVSKDVVVSYVGKLKYYDLKFKAANVSNVKIAGVSILPSEYVVYHNQPSYVIINKDVKDDDIVEISYSSLGKHDNYALNEMVIIYASALYNNAEGLDELDMRRINNRLTTLAG